MKGVTSKCCGTCEYNHLYGCRRYPPSMLMTGNLDKGYKYHRQYPKVLDTDYCGEYKEQSK